MAKDKAKKKKAKKVKRKKLPKLPCPGCGSRLEYREDGEVLYCPVCRKERLIPENMRDRLKMDTLSKPGRLFLVLLVIILVCGTVFAYFALRPGPALKETMLDALLEEKGAEKGEITVSVIWDNVDDLDLHVVTPSGEEVCLANRSAGGGVLDVEANSDENELTQSPVENIFFAAPAAGSYFISLTNYIDRTPESAANYLVRVTAGERVEIFRGTLNGDGATANLLELQYDLSDAAAEKTGEEKREQPAEKTEKTPESETPETEAPETEAPTGETPETETPAGETPG